MVAPHPDLFGQTVLEYTKLKFISAEWIRETNFGPTYFYVPHIKDSPNQKPLELRVVSNTPSGQVTYFFMLNPSDEVHIPASENIAYIPALWFKLEHGDHA